MASRNRLPKTTTFIRVDPQGGRIPLLPPTDGTNEFGLLSASQLKKMAPNTAVSPRDQTTWASILASPDELDIVVYKQT